jgi:hypothetical protein
MPTVPGSPPRATRPKQATPAERAVEFAAAQVKMKEEAAERRDAKALEQTEATPRKRGKRA